MNILLVNNHTKHLKYLNKALAGHNVEVVMYQPGVQFNYRDKDLIVLSGGGGEGLEIDDKVQSGKLWYEDEMKFILKCDKPILGICMGFEVIARSFGSQVKQMETGLLEGFHKISTTKRGKEVFDKDRLRQYEAHEWSVEYIDPEEFEVLAASHTGIEIIKHKKRPILATQFHPEKGGTLSLPRLLTI